MKAKVKFSDGTEITADVNENCYITAEKPSFPSNLEEVYVEEDQIQRILNSVMVQECASVDGRYWFTLIEKSEEQKEKESLLAEIESQAEAIIELAEIIGGGE